MKRDFPFSRPFSRPLSLPFALVAGLALLTGCSPATTTTPAADPASAVGAETIAPGYAVRGQIALPDLAELSKAGYRTIINNRPDGEEPGQPTSAEVAAEAARLGLAYHYIPVAKSGPTENDARALAAVLGKNPGPTLAFCRSGRRAAALKKLADGL
ncbi:MAG: TIGR01244 family sulfur transferase [Novosphingobium sp.]